MTSLRTSAWEARSAFLLTGKTGENFAPDGTVQIFPPEKVEREQLYHLTKFTLFSWESLGANWQQQTWMACRIFSGV